MNNGGCVTAPVKLCCAWASRVSSLWGEPLPIPEHAVLKWRKVCCARKAWPFPHELRFSFRRLVPGRCIAGGSVDAKSLLPFSVGHCLHRTSSLPPYLSARGSVVAADKQRHFADFSHRPGAQRGSHDCGQRPFSPGTPLSRFRGDCC